MKMSFKNAIGNVERAIGYDLSEEQLRVLRYDNRTPVLVNSCAGAGKTTLLEINCLVRIMRGELSAEQIIGITFSRKAKTDMVRKYKQMRNALAKQCGIRINGIPSFETFHALFLHLLNKTRKSLGKRRLIPLVSPFSLRVKKGQSPLFKAVKVQSPVKSTTDMINDVFRIRNYLVNNQISLDGLTCNLHGHRRRLTKKVLMLIVGDENLELAMDNYYPVMKCYTHYKHAKHRIDFTDMITRLYSDIQKPKYLSEIRKLLSNVRFCFIDEFQDIDRLQWVIMKDLTKGYVGDHLMTVGDDDQSIYSFRGSDPTIIMELPKHQKNLKVFHLSTNYRTGGNILRSVAPLIECNQYRYAKDLNSSRNKQGHGKLIEFVNYKTPYQSSKALFNKLRQVIRSSAVKDSRVAILCRYNIDLMLAVDSLANEGYYVRTNKRHLLQNDRIYKSFMDIMRGYDTDRFAPLKAHARQIGNGFDRHIEDVEHVTNHGKSFKHLSEYLHHAIWFDNHFLAGQINGQSDSDIDHKIETTIKNLKLEHSKRMCLKLFTIAGDMLHDYYQYMMDNHYISRQTIVKVYYYLKGIIKNVKNNKIKGFFGFERRKKYLLTHRSKRTKHFRIITIHASKGLQFEYVFLYNLDTYGITNRTLLLDRYFHPNMSENQFMIGLTSISMDELRKLNSTSSSNPIFEIWSDVLNDLYNGNYLRPYGALAFENLRPEMQEKVKAFHANVRAQVDDIEEERRLIYVAITRAEKRVYMNVDSSTTPLASELEVPSGNFITVGNVKDYSKYNTFNSKTMNKNGSRKHDVQTTLF